MLVLPRRVVSRIILTPGSAMLIIRQAHFIALSQAFVKFVAWSIAATTPPQSPYVRISSPHEANGQVRRA